MVPHSGRGLFDPKYGAAAGVMITGSHREAAVNGVKLFDRDGFSRPVPAGGCTPAASGGGGAGRVQPRRGAAEEYVTHLLAVSEVGLQGMRLAVDCASGAAAATAERLFSSLGAECYMMNAGPDGSRINRDSGPLNTGAWRTRWCAIKYFAGIALDGGAERCVLVDEKGNLLDGDKILAALIYDRQEKNSLPGGTVAVDAASNMGLCRFCEGLEISAVTVTEPSGIADELRRSGGVLGGGPADLCWKRRMPPPSTDSWRPCACCPCAGSGAGSCPGGGADGAFSQVMVSVRAGEEGKARFMLDSRLQSAVREAGEQLGHEGRVRAWVADAEPLIFVSAEGRILRK